jgi:hypothetical protein
VPGALDEVAHLEGAAEPEEEPGQEVLTDLPKGEAQDDRHQATRGQD